MSVPIHGLNTIRDTDLPTLRNMSRALDVGEAQSLIGWDHMVSGFLSPQWSLAQQAQYDYRGMDMCGRRWAQEMAKKVMSVAWDMWKHRNGIWHNTVTAAKQRWRNELVLAVDDQFAQGLDNLLRTDHHWLMSRPAKVIKAYDIELMRQWLESIELARARFEYRDQDLSASMRQQRDCLRHWVASGTDPDPESTLDLDSTPDPPTPPDTNIKDS
jgi:hypothetical protein